MSLSQRLEKAGLTLPEVAAPVAAYVPALRVAGSNIIRTSGQIPVVAGSLLRTGLVSKQAEEATGFSQTYVGADGERKSLKTPLISPERAYECAKICALNALAAAAGVAGGVDKIKQVLKVTVFVASARNFYGQAQVANGASELFGKLFDEGHIRSAVGVAVLPLNAPVEVEAEFLAE